ELKRNSFSDSFVDNVFNYVWVQHKNENVLHYLLLKVRILQIINNRRPEHVTFQQIWDKLKAFGYVNLREYELRDAFVILMSAGFVTQHYEGARSASYSIMPKGVSAIRGLLFSSAYWEQVFHQTLLPAIFLGDHIDHARDDDLEEWVRNAIRNY